MNTRIIYGGFMRPFEDKLLSDYLDSRARKINDYIENWVSNDVIMGNDLDILADNIYEQFYVLPIVLYEEDISRRMIKQKKVREYSAPYFRNITGREYVDVDGFCASFYYPYSGETELFECRASTFSTSGYPNIQVDKEYIILNLERSLTEMKQVENAKQISQQLQETMLKELNRGISFINKDVNSFNSRLKKDIKKQLQEKKDKVSTFYKIAEMFEVPVEKNEFAKTHITVTRNITPISHKYSTENIYCITDNDYNDILLFIKHTASTYESTPSSYKYMKEEDLRNTLLAALNGAYKGNAHGEAFRHKGKTDICIEMENRAAFVAECKMWTGPKGISKAIDQLDSYTTWRDCKIALIIFVRRKDFVALLDKTKSALKDIPNMRRVEEIDKNEFKCQYLSKSNPGQIIHLRVMLFNLYYDET